MNLKKLLFNKVIPIWGAFMALFAATGCNGSDKKQEIEDLKIKLEMLEQSKTDLSWALESYKSQVKDLSQENAELQAQVDSFEEENKELQAIIDRMNTPSTVNNNVDTKHSISLFYKDGKLSIDYISSAFQFTSEAKDIHVTPGYSTLYTDFPEIYGYYPIEIEGSYKTIMKDGINFLVDASDYNKVYLSGFDKLGDPFYLKYHDPANGGVGAVGKYPGYVLPYYDELGRFYLADLNTFETLLYAIDPIDFTNYKHDDKSEKNASKNPVRNWFESQATQITAYAAENNGNDDPGKYSGEAFIFYKNGIPYCVDANDFTKVLAIQFEAIGCSTDTIEIMYNDGRIDCYDGDAFYPTSSEDLVADQNASIPRLK